MRGIPGMAGLTRQVWFLPGRSTACCQRCAFRLDHIGSQRARRVAREHTRRTGHTTRSAEIKVTEYRSAA